MREDYFPALKKEFDKYGMKIFNCNPNSTLEAFDYVKYDDAVKESLFVLGDTERELSAGMYRTFNEKLQAMDPDLKELKETGTIKGKG